MRRLFPDPGELAGAEELEDEYLRPPGRHVRVNFVMSLDAVKGDITIRVGPQK